ncbi:MipA/OmpV family protein [Pseudoalteromonas fenneropenaei]|uniref:MipA/OmpV family protein n=1 Tax=Pseudoalteromonas fenneropenaei TaxID=1737459 RepID=A0ABV7CI18_9GAMM
MTIRTIYNAAIFTRGISDSAMRVIALFLLFLTVHQSAFAANRLYADNQFANNAGFTWDWSVGAQYTYEDPYLEGLSDASQHFEANLNLALSYGNFYLDFDQSQLSGGLILGYNLFDHNSWSLDVVGLQLQPGFSESGSGLHNSKVIKEALRGIKTRNYDFDVGVRLTRQYHDTQLSVELLHDVTGSHNGWIATSFLSHIHPWRNWEFRSGVGFNAYSEAFADYYFGVSPTEATTSRNAYKSDTAFALLFEFHAEYPLNQHWVFLAGWMSTWFSPDIANSPLVQQDYQHKAMVGVRYVF